MEVWLCWHNGFPCLPLIHRMNEGIFHHGIHAMSQQKSARAQEKDRGKPFGHCHAIGEPRCHSLSLKMNRFNPADSSTSGRKEFYDNSPGHTLRWRANLSQPREGLLRRTVEDLTT